MKTQKVWFITGASRGFGLEIAREALTAGDQVVATVRREGRSHDVSEQRHENGTGNRSMAASCDQY